jgi:tetratricopeptide (TPR) repeat protein
LTALQLEPENSDIYWRLARAQVDIGEHQPEKEQEAYFARAVAYADSAIKYNPGDYHGHLRRAISLGKLALFKGVFKSVSMVKQVKQSLDTSLSINSEVPVAHYVMARTHQKLCEKPKIARVTLGLDWADRGIAEKEYLIAINLDPNFIMFRMDYAKLLMELDRYNEARIQLQKIAELPIKDEDDAELKKEAVTLLSGKKFQ